MQSSRWVLPRWLQRATHFQPAPSFLCQAARHLSLRPRYHHELFARPRPRCMHTEVLAAPAQHLPPPSLPVQCSGCGAFSQTTSPDQAGFFDLGRNSVKRYLGLVKDTHWVRPEESIVRQALEALGDETSQLHGLTKESLLSPSRPADSESSNHTPLIVCARCHDLVHHSSGVPIYHPGIDSIRETIDESPYKYNHVYHVIDAADFPMSLLPRIHDLLDLTPLRSRNRRSRQGRFYHGRKNDMSFIITRSDLLAPTKNRVDSLQPWLIETLRDALGRVGKNVRLGNVHCVSAKRSWGTKELREEVWQHGGASWMVGKANVGKSYLFQHIFPKGRMDWETPKHDIAIAVSPDPAHLAGSQVMPPEPLPRRLASPDTAALDQDGLLPPALPETNYPQMPVVSALPGTTASPIRIPFGNGKGELIDLPGLERSALVEYVEPRHRDALIMKDRIKPKQEVLKGHWNSLLLGGFIRLTPRTKDLVFLTYNFTPLQEHRTLTDKAIGIQAQSSDLKIENISVPGTGEKIKLAGSFRLEFDVTKQRTGPITRRDAANIKVERLPYRVVAVDILIEGCGWVEVVAQVRAKDLYRKDHVSDRGLLQSLDLSQADPTNMEAFGAHDVEATDLNWPVIDVYSPEGRFVSSRRPMNGWLLFQPPKSSLPGSRPRRSMKGAKKMAKAAARAAQTVTAASP